MLPVDRKQVKFMVAYLMTQRNPIIVLFLLIGVNIFLQIYNPQFVQSFIDAAVEGEERSALAVTALLFLLLSLVRQAITIVIQYVTSEATWKITNKLRLDLTNRCLAYDLSFHNRHTPGEMVDRIDGDVGRLNNFLSAFALKVISNYLLIAAILIIIYVIHPLIGAAVTVSVLLGLFVLNKLSSFGSATIHHYLAESASFIGFIDERIAGREDIRALKAERHILNTFYSVLRRLYRIRKKTGTNVATVINAGELVLALNMASTLLVMGLIYLYDTRLSLGTMFLVYYYMTILLVPMKNIVNEVSDLQQVNASLSRINELLNYRSKVEDTGCLRITESRLSIRFDEVSFSYDNDVRGIHNVSFAIPANRTVGIIGRSGSGKSTLAKLIYRLCDAQHGTISINGTDIRRYSLENLRSGIAVISQNIELFEGSLRENITMFKENVSDEDILNIIGLLCMKGWIDNIPEGLDKKIERDGKNLSAGEAQLIAFARAFLMKPQIVILDEATSRIDPVTEKLIEGAFSILMKNCTVIVIAHRLSTIRKSDYILIMQEGEVIEFGETKKLEWDTSSTYFKLIGAGDGINA